jgi:hypothetical protein
MNADASEETEFSDGSACSKYPKKEEKAEGHPAQKAMQRRSITPTVSDGRRCQSGTENSHTVKNQRRQAENQVNLPQQNI